MDSYNDIQQIKLIMQCSFAYISRFNAQFFFIDTQDTEEKEYTHTNVIILQSSIWLEKKQNTFFKNLNFLKKFSFNSPCF